MKKHTENITLFLLILMLGLFFHKNNINEFPSYVHAWAQSDRYAISLGFVDNNLNFFKPQTFVYNHQFPDNWRDNSATTITAVDFPIHDYIVGVIMKITGNQSPWIFRLYLFLYSVVGLFFLFQLAKLLTNNVFKSVFVVLFAATSPVFVYYQSGFLPTIPSLANTFIAMYFYIKYLSSNKPIQFNVSIAFLTLATLSRTTFAIPLIAVLGYEFLRVINKKTPLKPKILPVLISIILIMGYFFYNHYLRAKYGSIFLNTPLPPKNINEALALIKTTKQNWLFQYFSKVHYILFLVAFLLFFVLAIFKKTQINKLLINSLLLTLIILLGCVMFAGLMAHQFPYHDYYFLDTFFLPVLMLLLFLVSSISITLPKKAKFILVFGLVAISVPLILKADKVQKDRRITGFWDKTNATINNFKDSESFLDTLNISKDAKMLVIDPYAPNIPFILMNRKGFAVMSTTRENIAEALDWDYDFVITQNDFFLSNVYSPYPEIIQKTQKLWDNGKISIAKRKDQNSKISIAEYLGLNKRTPVRKEKMTYENIDNPNWKAINQCSDYAFSGKFSGNLKPNNPYGLTYKTKEFPEITQGKRTIHFQSYLLHHSDVHEIKLVISVTDNENNLYYKTYELERFLKQTDIWEKVDLIFELPKIENQNYEFTMFLWNVGENQLYIDDFEFIVY